MISKLRAWWQQLPYVSASEHILMHLWQKIADTFRNATLHSSPLTIITLQTTLHYAAMNWTFLSTVVGFSCAWWWVRHCRLQHCAQSIVTGALLSFLPTCMYYGLSDTETLLPILVYHLIWVNLARSSKILLPAIVALGGGLVGVYLARQNHWQSIGLLPHQSAPNLGGLSVLLMLVGSIAVLMNSYDRVIQQAVALFKQRANHFAANTATLDGGSQTGIETLEAALRSSIRQAECCAETTIRQVHDLRHWYDDMNVHLFLLGERIAHDIQTIEIMLDIEHTQQAIKDLLDTMLDGAKLAHNALELHIEPMQLNLLLTSVIGGLQPRFLHNHCYLRVLTDLQPCWVYAEPQVVGRVLRNILINALNHTASTRDDAAVEVYMTVGEKETVLTVRDNGRGIDADLLRRLATPFTTTNGTGLGLHYCKSMMTRYPGGSFAIDSAGIGAGTTVTLTFATMRERAE